MTESETKDLEVEINHIFESGANEIRILEMVKLFVSKRYNFVSKDIKSFPKTGEEFLTRNANQGGTLRILKYNTIHKHFESKGEYVYRGQMPTHWMAIPNN